MQIRDRIKDFRRVRADSLQPHPKNWRTHPDHQRDALRGVLAEIGYADALIVRELADGSLELIDGHLRAETTPEAEVPVLVVDLNDDEAAKLLAVHDPLAALAETNHGVLIDLFESIETENDAVRKMLDNVAGTQAATLPIDPAPTEVDIPETFQVVVECRNEDEQRTVFERLESEGYRCKLLML